jgi:group I intron endonuclease
LFTIYRATNITNGKVYIGFDSKWPNRKAQHLKKYKNERYKTAFYSALRKHGEHAFVWDVLYQSEDGDHCLNVMEPQFIAEHQSFGPGGYNLTAGGEGCLGRSGPLKWKTKVKTKEHGDAISRAKKGVPLTEQHKQALSEAKKQPVVVNGVHYPTKLAAMRALHVRHATLMRMLQSDTPVLDT